MDEREQQARLHAQKTLARFMPATTKEISRRVWRKQIAKLPLEILNWFVREGDKDALEIWRERCCAERTKSGTVDGDTHALAWELALDGIPPARTGPKPYDRIWRDLFISFEVKVLVQDFSLKATRNDATMAKGTVVSACQIVSEESPLGHRISEPAVRKIWKHSAAKFWLEREENRKAEAVGKIPPSNS